MGKDEKTGMQFSVSLKLTVIIVFISIILIASLTGLFLQNQEENFKDQEKFLHDKYRESQIETTLAFMDSFNSSISNIENYNIQDYNDEFENFSHRNDHSLRFYINLFENEKFTIIASNGAFSCHP